MMSARLTILFLLTLALIACAQTPPADSPQEREQLQVDPEVQFSMRVTELFEERLQQASGDSLLQIQFAVKASSGARMAWKVTWFDADGRKIDSVGESYREASLLAGQTRYFTATAPHPDVVDYQLHLREPG
ncbi:YcfL family protein [Marinobacter sp.]|uniref:YcfL family protein n=1 Tax=Marinobacter sp. TaxID=50741 RepID=UPI0038510C9D